MSISINVKADVKALTKGLNKLQRKVIPTATARAINKTAATTRNETARTIASELHLKLPFVRKRFYISKWKQANKTKLATTIDTRRSDTNIAEWTTKSQLTNLKRAQKQGGIKSKAWGGAAKIYKGTFAGKGKNSGKTLVYAVSDKHASGVKAIYGPDLRAWVRRPTSQARIRRVVRRRFRVVFSSELSHALSRIK